jgi:uncharacterized repeat protein (TIGR03803 family)
MRRSAALLPWFLCTLMYFHVNQMASAQSTEQIIYSFNLQPDGYFPTAPLVADGQGNLYGGTFIGGTYGKGCVFGLSRSGSGWVETVLYSFTGGIDGNGPEGALTFDKSGNLWGATGGGGAYKEGAIFELTPNGGGSWSETVVYSFGASSSDGYGPQGSLIFDAQGNAYGVTQASNGTRKGGTVFKLSLGANGWQNQTLYTFAYPSQSGPAFPVGGLTMDAQGNLYGVTSFGGTYNAGAVFEMVHAKNGKYVEKVLHNFDSADGLEPLAGLTLGANGTLYGAVSLGGSLQSCRACGVVFELKKDSGGNWNETVLYQLDGTHGAVAIGPVVFDSLGNAYIATQVGGPSIYDIGCVLELTPSASGPWTPTVLHDFLHPNYMGTDGKAPYGGVIIDHGQLYGTTSSGGANDAGTVFEVQLPNP